MTSPSAPQTRIERLKLLLPLEVRLELVRRALEERRSIEAQAEHMLAQMLKRSSARRARIGGTHD